MARNRAEDPKIFKMGFENLEYIKQEKDTKYCIFISHKHENAKEAKAIGDYIKKANIDIYLDKEDSGLQKAVKNNDDKEIVRSIEKGIAASTHILCILSKNTKDSWWVPYEIGYAKKAKKGINSLLLKNITDIPSFLKIENLIPRIENLNKFLQSLNTNKLENYSHYSGHSLEEYMEK